VTKPVPEPLEDHHNLQPFDCGDIALNAWLKQRAMRNEGKYARTFVVSDTEGVIGYYCLSAGAVARADLAGPMRRNAPGLVPITLLGRIAVDLGYQRKGLGTLLLHDALARAILASRSVGSRSVLLHAKNEQLREYYTRFGFRSLPGHPLTMDLPMEMAIAALDAED
jgi:GNAT superfamily N-acetyltransferase